jgi:flagellar basal-body rod modification protein FlgD
MATAAGIFNHQMTAGQALTRNAATPMASAPSGTSGASGSGDSSDSSATISANDFLTLLVTEMQNQDPTSDTDPNEYINQLVNVNSLEQLIDINQTLSTDLGSTSTTSGTGSTPQVSGAASSATNAATPASAAASPRTAAHLAGSPLSSSPVASNASAPQVASAQRISGNLSAPNPSPAARRVGHALAGRTHAASVGGTSPATQ